MPRPKTWRAGLQLLRNASPGAIQGKVAAYQIWNEPNLSREWGDNAARPGRLRRAAGRLQRGDPRG